MTASTLGWKASVASIQIILAGANGNLMISKAWGLNLRFYQQLPRRYRADLFNHFAMK
jgi:hypothetical protein